jgi:hypothetical protein
MESKSRPAGIQWRRSSYSGDQGGNCVEIAKARGSVAVRDSKNPAGPHLTLDPAAFTTFLGWAVGGYSR